jgi:catechol 2,3-dioxygenase-like lactoylglutathione lyase family enzyme
MDRVVAFLLTTIPETALTFYRDKLECHYVRDDGFALIFDLNGVMLRIGKVKAFTPAPNTVLGWECRDIVESLGALTARGIVFERYSGMSQDERGIATFPNGDKVAWFKDPDGNVLSLSQHVS